MRLVFERLRNANLSINLKKSCFAKREFSFWVTSLDLMVFVKVRVIVDFPQPQNKNDILRSHVFCSYISSFIPHLCDIMEPLHRLTKKNIQFFWGPKIITFQKIKDTVCENALLHGIDYRYALCICTDASDIGMRALLFQEIADLERVIAYASKMFRDTEVRSLCAVEKECKAILFGLA